MELTWKQFISLNYIKNLPLNEQAKRYRYYLEELSSMNNYQNKGPLTDSIPVQPFSGFLLQENGFYILQEDGSKIYL